ncbi:leucine-rich repeat and coiled-coil domain-containing protein PF3D7_0703800-like [Clytia hemisphaerica]|uniref:leucine-rich repeat and coiled-coil domain-containing protein PF3D7_0703800-like n=1 Tax=Clytia hemisphaerica TaxID=252671 RepID=UPI0034D51751
MGTRSWDVERPRYEVGESAYVKASYFDSNRPGKKYSDYFKHKEETLLQGKILSINENSVRMKFEVDGTISTIKYNILVKVTDHNKHLIQSDDTEELPNDDTEELYNDETEELHNDETEELPNDETEELHNENESLCNGNGTDYENSPVFLRDVFLGNQTSNLSLEKIGNFAVY